MAIMPGESMAPLPPLMAAAIGCASTLAATLVPGALVPWCHLSRPPGTARLVSVIPDFLWLIINPRLTTVIVRLEVCLTDQLTFLWSSWATWLTGLLCEDSTIWPTGDGETEGCRRRGLLLCAGEIVITPPLLDEVTRGKLPGVLRRNCFVSLATNVRMKHRGGEEVVHKISITYAFNCDASRFQTPGYHMLGSVTSAKTLAHIQPSQSLG